MLTMTHHVSYMRESSPRFEKSSQWSASGMPVCDLWVPWKGWSIKTGRLQSTITNFSRCSEVNKQSRMTDVDNNRHHLLPSILSITMCRQSFGVYKIIIVPGHIYGNFTCGGRLTATLQPVKKIPRRSSYRHPANPPIKLPPDLPRHPPPACQPEEPNSVRSRRNHHHHPSNQKYIVMLHETIRGRKEHRCHQRGLNLHLFPTTHLRSVISLPLSRSCYHFRSARNFRDSGNTIGQLICKAKWNGCDFSIFCTCPLPVMWE